MRWIKTEKQLPEPDVAVLGYWPDGGKDPDDQYCVVYLKKPKKTATHWVSDLSKCPGLVWPPHEITRWCYLEKRSKKDTTMYTHHECDGCCIPK